MFVNIFVSDSGIFYHVGYFLHLMEIILILKSSLLLPQYLHPSDSIMSEDCSLFSVLGHIAHESEELVALLVLSRLTFLQFTGSKFH